MTVTRTTHPICNDLNYPDNILSVCRAAPQSWSEYTTFDKVQYPRAGQNIPPSMKSNYGGEIAQMIRWLLRIRCPRVRIQSFIFHAEACLMRLWCIKSLRKERFCRLVSTCAVDAFVISDHSCLFQQADLTNNEQGLDSQTLIVAMLHWLDYKTLKLLQLSWIQMILVIKSIISIPCK